MVGGPQVKTPRELLTAALIAVNTPATPGYWLPRQLINDIVEYLKAEKNKPAVERPLACLVYQCGIANVFLADASGWVRRMQSDFSHCEAFCAGLVQAGCEVAFAWCAEAGDIISRPWHFEDFGQAPFSEHFFNFTNRLNEPVKIAESLLVKLSPTSGYWQERAKRHHSNCVVRVGGECPIAREASE